MLLFSKKLLILLSKFILPSPNKKSYTGGPRLSGPQLPGFRNTGIEKKVPSPRLSGIPRNSGIPISNRYPGILRNS